MLAKAAVIRRKSAGANDEAPRKGIRQLNATLDFCGYNESRIITGKTC